MDDFRNIETMDLCKKDKVKSKLFMCQKYGVRFSTINNVDNEQGDRERARVFETLNFCKKG